MTSVPWALAMILVAKAINIFWSGALFRKVEAIFTFCTRSHIQVLRIRKLKLHAQKIDCLRALPEVPMERTMCITSTSKI